jgi:hypothetical protein
MIRDFTFFEAEAVAINKRAADIITKAVAELRALPGIRLGATYIDTPIDAADELEDLSKRLSETDEVISERLVCWDEDPALERIRARQDEMRGAA